MSYNEFYHLPQWTLPQQYQYSPYQFTYYTDVQTVHQSPPVPARRKRASKPKVKTGCTTCKIRRVKCDEAKPACNRCTSTGRKCDGYRYPSKDSGSQSTDAGASTTPQGTPPAEKKQRTDAEVFVSQVDHGFQGTVQERRAFHRFKYCTVPAFAGGSENEFWTDLVLRAATTEPVIRDAVVALGSLHEEYENRGGVYDFGVNLGNKETAILYGKAIRGLYQRIDRVTGETASLAVIASILFAGFEVLRRNNMAAVVHYQNGMRQLMKQMRGEVVRSRPQDDLDRMLRVFTRYDVQACSFSKTRAEPLKIMLDPVPNDVGLSQVRHYLDNLLIAIYQLIKSDLGMFRYWTKEEVAEAWLEKRDEALSTFQQWLDVLEESIPSDAVTLRNHGITASKSILGLILQVKVAMILLKTCIDCGPETTFDQFQTEFEDMVTRTEDMIKVLGLSNQRDTVPFSMELGVIHPMFFVAWKCRNSSIRRRAISVLRKCGKEGVWEGPIMAEVAQRLVDIEEQGLKPGQFVPESARIHDLQKTVDYEGRVVRAEIRIAKDTTWKNWTVSRESIPF